MSFAFLFAPGHEPRKLEKALRLGVAVIADWEDGVPPQAKEEARHTTLDLLQQLPQGIPVYVRLNPATSPYFEDDVKWLTRLPEAIGCVLPRAEDPRTIARLGDLGRRVIPLIETPAGLYRARELAQAHPHVERLALGYLDYLAEIGGRWIPTGEPLLLARSWLVLVSRLASIGAPLDGVYPHLEDLAGLKAEAEMARNLGFYGKLAVHPHQLPVIEEAFRPSPEEIRWAEEVVRRYREAMEQGKGAIRLEGQLVDPPVYRKALDILEAGGRGEG
ncbi:MAG: CoA ester lyase [Clostridiales bacterium]|nr:CoA ester lyase [Clostridiales bacterium]